MNARALILLTIFVCSLIVAVSALMNHVVDRYEPVIMDLGSGADTALAMRTAKDGDDIAELFNHSAELYARHVNATTALVSLVDVIRSATQVLYMTAGLNIGIVIVSLVHTWRKRRRNEAQQSPPAYPEGRADAPSVSAEV